ncbi:FIG00849341: hypothetical protein [Olavius sp. associated proteobacterium Delta 1]|nr:FIG00849341: hypothetical protein [Olavius sp. associated proteobacterium Delta 1]
MINFLLAGQNMPFTVALTVMLIIAFLEGVSTLLGAGIFSFIDSLLPELDIDADVDADIDSPDFESSGLFSRLFSWLRIGEVPAIMLLVIFLTAFGLIGLGLQSFAQKTLGSLLPGSFASIPAVLLGFPIVRLLGGILGKIMPKDETEAVAETSFIGRIAVITLGNASPGKPAEAKLSDQFGQAHYVMVEPDEPDERFESGTQVVLVSQQGAIFKAIRNKSDALVDD